MSKGLIQWIDCSAKKRFLIIYLKERKNDYG